MDIGSLTAPGFALAAGRPRRIEIERKFLVRDDAWRSQVVGTRDLRDGLLSAEAGNKVRVRTDGRAAWLTVKGPRAGLARPEYEYPIPLADAEAMLDRLCGSVVLEKRRHVVHHQRHVWEVDVYAGVLAGIVHAEIELAAEDEDFERPAWLGAEITGDPAHSKRAMLLLAGVSVP